MFVTLTRRIFTGPAVAAVAMLAAGLVTTDAAQAADPFVLHARGDDVEAVARLVRLAQAGNARAQGLLGFLYEQGRGVPQNFELAAMWYGCAAERGDVTAQYLLGLLYDKGRGVPLDVVLSQKWLILAAARAGPRDRDAYTRIRDAVATKMSESQRALAQAMATAWAPAPPAPVRW